MRCMRMGQEMVMEGNTQGGGRRGGGWDPRTAMDPTAANREGSESDKGIRDGPQGVACFFVGDKNPNRLRIVRPD